MQTLLIGANGQGKTNVLQALYVGSHARSFRTANERELMQHGQPKAQIKLVLDGPQGLTDLEICWTDASMLDPSQPKRLKVGFTRNGVTLKSRFNCWGRFPPSPSSFPISSFCVAPPKTAAGGSTLPWWLIRPASLCLAGRVQQGASTQKPIAQATP